MVFAKPNRFPSLERLKIVLDMHWLSWARAAIGRVRVPLAIDRIPSLKHLHIVGEFYIAPNNGLEFRVGLTLGAFIQCQRHALSTQIPRSRNAAVRYTRSIYSWVVAQFCASVTNTGRLGKFQGTQCAA